MHGMVHAELRDYIIGELTYDGWERLARHAGLSTKPYFLSESYADESLVAMLAAYSRATGQDVPDVLAAFGRALVPRLLDTYGSFVEPRWSALDLIENSEVVMHRTVRLQNPTATPPLLTATRVAAGEVRMVYASPRKLCPLGKGIVKGIADHYGEAIALRESSCMLLGDATCDLSITTTVAT